MVLFFIKTILAVIPVLVSVAFITLLERKILSLVGLRVGPNKISLMGFLQPLADAAKLMNKQTNVLSNFNYLFYYSSSFMMLIGALLIWGSFNFNPPMISFKFSVILLFTILSLNSLNSILAGWSTFSKFSLIGSIRTVCQLISYESALYLCLFAVIFVFFSFNYQVMSFFPIYMSFFFLPTFFFIWLPSFLAELNRTPYDFSEGESELVSGFNTEYGSLGFTLLFLAEYSSIIFFSGLSSLIFFWGVDLIFFFLCFIFIIWIRSVLPRYRFDKLMGLAWKFFIPFLTVCFLALVLSF